MSNLDEFLKQNSQPERRCLCCTNQELCRDIEKFLDMLEKGKTFITLNFLHRKYLKPKYGMPKDIKSLYGHVRECLKRDYKTGKRLDV